MVENLAGVGKRVLGAIIDVVVLMIVFVVYAMMFGTIENGFISVTGIPALILFILLLLYFIVMEATTGKTIGKYIAKTKVVNEDGKKISWGQSTGRNLMRIVDGFFFYLVGFVAIIASKNNQRLGDMVSETYVINE
jgi:uncharacterized RDD family membrane protein YckC